MGYVILWMCSESAARILAPSTQTTKEHTMVTHIFVRLYTALASLFALPDEPHTSEGDPSELWRYHASFYYTWYW
jgi:hypothetical protein